MSLPSRSNELIAMWADLPATSIAKHMFEHLVLPEGWFVSLLNQVKVTSEELSGKRFLDVTTEFSMETADSRKIADGSYFNIGCLIVRFNLTERKIYDIVFYIGDNQEVCTLSGIDTDALLATTFSHLED